MTQSRPEIVIEGSMDGQTWKEYEFNYKPGNLYRALPIVAPHQPRLDWQMWFAALSNFRQSFWLQNFMLRLFQNSAPVLGLLAENPFPDQPPRYLRARLYQYEFAPPEEIVGDGTWWKRRLTGEYSPVIENNYQ